MVINTQMSNKKNLPSDAFFNSVDFVGIVDNIKNIYMSDGAMSTLLDFERCLDMADIYAFKNWIKGELVDGPIIGRYSCKCTFMWPHKLMPDPRGGARLEKIGCTVVYGKKEIRVPVEIKDYDDFVPGTRYPRMKERKVWFVQITIPNELMNDVKEGTIQLADEVIDLSDIDEAYDEDLDDSTQSDTGPETDAEQNQNSELEPNPAMPQIQ